MSYQIPDHIKQNPEKRWNVSDKVFFSCGACHMPFLCVSQIKTLTLYGYDRRKAIEGIMLL